MDGRDYGVVTRRLVAMVSPLFLPALLLQCVCVVEADV